MPAIRPMTIGLLVALTGATGAYAQGTTPPAGQAPPPPPPAQAAQGVTYKETVVVSASKTEQQLVDAPATMTVIGPRALSVAPSNNYADLLRNVPGLNITQISARDVNVTSRGATSSLATSQLAVVDGRSLYQDFFGFTMWDFMPANLDEIKRIEVIRGPASAVWGANALNGVINVITKSPRENPGTTVTLGGGLFNRDVGDVQADSGSVFYLRGTHNQIVNDRLAYKLSAGTYSSDALARPVGFIPNGGTTPYPPYTNQGTQQPKFDARFDYDFPDGERKLQFSGGYAATDGIMHTGIGPFDVKSGSAMSYWKVNFTRKAFKFQAFMNMLDGEAANLVSISPTNVPIDLDFNTKTFDFEVGDTHLVAARHALTYGGNLRFNRFDLTIAPGEDSRTEGGAYVQDEILLHERFRLVAGARVDKFSSIESAVFSPRIAAVIKPKPDQSVRVTYNRAFRAPSMVNNNLDVTLGNPLPLGLISPLFVSQVFLVPTHAVGNPDLVEESIDAFEVSYTGNIRNRASVSAAWYYTKFSDQIFFTTTGTWQTPPPGFPGLGPAPPSVIWGLLLQRGIVFPSDFTYLNLGEVRSKGLELGIDGTLTDSVSAFVNYSFQADPHPNFPGLTEAEALREINIPAKHLFNAGVSCITPRTFATVSVSHSSEAFWQDVLDSRFHGPTKPYTMVNLTAGVKFSGGRYSAALKIVNLGNEEVQQHVFGDVLKRQIMVEVKMGLKKM
ncbi:MAG TPA: TonB-dependent receptor [Vicinamibacterales bacterium]|nr:TonB-dependent receptor [Vicinamibacterales bacterium]